MKSKPRVLICLIVWMLLLLPEAELAAQTSSGPTPTYVETDLTAASGLTRPGQPFKTNDAGQLLLIDTVKERQVFMVLDSTGTTVKSFPIEVAEGASAFALDPAGNVCFFGQQTLKSGAGNASFTFNRYLVVYSADGKKLKTVSLGQVASSQNDPWYLVDLAVDAKGTLYAATNKGVEVFTADGKPGRQLASYLVQGIGLDSEGKVYAAGYSMKDYKSFLEKLDPTNGKQVWRTELGDMPVTLRLDRKAKSIAVLDQRFVTTYTTDGKQVARIFEMKNSSVIGQYVFNASFTLDASGNVYFIARKPAAKDSDPWIWTLYRYSVSTQIAQKKNTLTISHGYWFDRFPDAAITLFQRNHPDWKVEYLRTIEEKDMGGEDIRQSVATELMAGRGADIISLAYTPYHDFIDKGLLVDLDKLAASDKTFPMASLRKNVLDAFRYKGSLYALPVQFSQDVLFGNKKVLDDVKIAVDDTHWTWQDFFAVADKIRQDTNGDGLADRFALPRMDANTLFVGYVFPNIRDSFVNVEKKQARLGDPQFISILKDVKAFTERNADRNTVDVDKWITGMQNGSVAFMINFLTSPLEVQMYGSVFKNGVRILSMPTSGSLGDEAWSSLTFGINSNSKHQKEAFEFLKLLVSEQLQQDQNIFGIPVNTRAYEKNVLSLKAATAKGQVMGGFGPGATLIYKELSDDDIRFVGGFFDRITRSRYMDAKLSSILGGELRDFFSGKRTAEEACKTLQQKVMTWLQE